jgi:hypothetical protein
VRRTKILPKLRQVLLDATKKPEERLAAALESIAGDKRLLDEVTAK